MAVGQNPAGLHFLPHGMPGRGHEARLLCEASSFLAYALQPQKASGGFGAGPGTRPRGPAPLPGRGHGPRRGGVVCGPTKSFPRVEGYLSVRARLPDRLKSGPPLLGDDQKGHNIADPRSSGAKNVKLGPCLLVGVGQASSWLGSALRWQPRPATASAIGFPAAGRRHVSEIGGNLLARTSKNPELRNVPYITLHYKQNLVLYDLQ